MPEAYRDDRISIELLPALGRMGNNSYILRPVGPDGTDGPATVIDLPEGSEAIIESLGDTPVERLVVTHSHFDHWLGYDVIRAHTDAPVFAGSVEMELDESRDIQPLYHGQAFNVGTAEVRVLHTPGHTPGSICLFVDGQGGDGVVITGDTLFPGGPGRTGSNLDLMQEIDSITQALYRLPDAVSVYPGHGDSTTIGDSRAEYEDFATREHASDLHGDVLWTN